jgi:hypothetical protein
MYSVRCRAIFWTDQQQGIHQNIFAATIMFQVA